MLPLPAFGEDSSRGSPDALQLRSVVEAAAAASTPAASVRLLSPDEEDRRYLVRSIEWSRQVRPNVAVRAALAGLGCVGVGYALWWLCGGGRS